MGVCVCVYVRYGRDGAVQLYFYTKETRRDRTKRDGQMCQLYSPDKTEHLLGVKGPEVRGVQKGHDSDTAAPHKSLKTPFYQQYL